MPRMMLAERNSDRGVMHATKASIGIITILDMVTFGVTSLGAYSMHRNFCTFHIPRHAAEDNRGCAVAVLPAMRSVIVRY